MLVEKFTEVKQINFLVYDSTMFDGVGSRQIAQALEHAHKKGLETGFQYICAFNSDVVPYDDFNEGFELLDHVRLTLSDSRLEDSLLGFQCEIKERNQSRKNELE